MKRIFSTGFAALALSTVFAAAPAFAQDAAAQFPPVPSAPVVAHRGFSAIAPENTLTSVQKAIEVGAQGCEFDVYSSTDGFLFLQHDGNLKRNAGLDLATKAADYATLSKLDFGAWKGDEFKGEKVASYETALALLKNTNTRPVVEVKENGFEEKIVEGIRRFNLVETAIVIDFSAARVKKMRELEPNLCVAWLCSFKVAEETPESMANKIIETLKGCKTNVVDVEASAVTPEFLQRLADAGITVMCWTVDDPARIKQLVEMGVVSITTNRPDLVLEARKAFENK